MLADRKQLLAPAGSAVVLADDLAPLDWEANGGQWGCTVPPPTSIPSFRMATWVLRGLCCMIGYIQLLHSAGLEECCRCAPSRRLVSGARRDIKALLMRGWEGSGRVMSHWAELGGHWACHMADGWFTTPLERWGLIAPHASPTHPHILLTDSPYCLPPLQCFYNLEHHVLSLQSSLSFSQALTEAPVLIPAPVKSAPAFHALLWLTVCVSLTFSFFLSVLSSAPISCTY